MVDLYCALQVRGRLNPAASRPGDPVEIREAMTYAGGDFRSFILKISDVPTELVDAVKWRIMERGTVAKKRRAFGRAPVHPIEVPIFVKDILRAPSGVVKKFEEFFDPDALQTPDDIPDIPWTFLREKFVDVETGESVPALELETGMSLEEIER